MNSDWKGVNRGGVEGGGWRDDRQGGVPEAGRHRFIGILCFVLRIFVFYQLIS